MEVHSTNGCCAAKELTHISDNAGTPDLTIRHVMAMSKGGGTAWGGPVRYSLSAFYIFTEVVTCKCGDNCDTGYGAELARYIRKHRLGAVTSSMRRSNRVNHPEHMDRVYVWAPTEKSMLAWYNRETKK